MNPSADLQHVQLLTMQRMLARANNPRRGPGRPRKRPIISPVESKPARVADEPRMALAFLLRRMEGIGWDRAAHETAAEFYLTGTRAASKVERASKEWRAVVVPFLIERFPEAAERLREFLRERRA